MARSLTRCGEFADDAAGGVLVDFTMTRNGLQDAGYDVAIPIVVGSVSDKDGAVFLNPSNQVETLHA